MGPSWALDEQEFYTKANVEECSLGFLCANIFAALKHLLYTHLSICFTAPVGDEDVRWMRA